MNLYNLTTELALLNNQIEEADGELTIDLEASLDVLNLSIAEKCGGIAKWVCNVDADSRGCVEEIKQLTLKKEAAENLKKRLKDYLMAALRVADLRRVSNGIHTVRRQDNSVATLEIENADLIPEHLVTYPRVVDNLAVRDELECGNKVPGAKLVRGEHIRVA